MDICLLCQESVKSLNDYIMVQSEKWNGINVKDLIDIHLWPMQQMSSTSWICTGCGEILYSFNKFYKRIKCVHQNYTSILKNEDNVSESDQKYFMDSGINKNMENFKDCDINEDFLNESHVETRVIMEHPLPTEFVVEDPYMTCETEDNLDHDKDEQKSKRKKRSRRAKDESLKAIEDREDPLMKIQKVKRKTRSIKILVSDETDMVTENEKDFEPARIHSSPLDIKDNNDSETDPEQAESETKATKKKNHRNLDEKTLREYDKIIADNFKIFCNLCQSEMDNFLSLRKHFKMEHKQRGYARCCKRNFFTRSLLVDHIHVHLNPDYFKCEQCSKIFSDRSRLLCHKKLHDDDSKLDKCNMCGKLFADKGALKKHVLTHSSQKLFPCAICGKFFTNSFILNHHVEAVHQNKFVQICEICGKSIRCPTAFASHMEKHEVKTIPISCDICGLLLTNKEGLKRHRNSQHPEGGKKEHTCHICSKVSPTQRALKSHIRSVHEQGFDFKCNLCEKSFKRPAVLREHMATHTGTALYTCPWCPRTFISNGNMYNHRKNAHPKEWEELKRQKYAGNLSKD